MKLMLLLAVLLTSLSIAGAPEPKVYFMFFMKGDGQRPSDADVLKEMQAKHIANMVKQAEKGKLVAAGPLQDPTQQRRGITVLTVMDEKEIPELFIEDSFVAHKLMKVAAFEWTVDRKKFKPAVDPSAMAEYRLVLLKRGMGMSPETDAMREAHRDLLNKMKDLAVWGPVKGMDGVREVLIFTSKDTEAIEAALKQDEYVKKALLEIEILPLWMSKGVVGG